MLRRARRVGISVAPTVWRWAYRISTASEYGRQDLNRLVQLVVERKMPAVSESSVSHRSIEAPSRGAEGEGHTVRLGGELYWIAPGWIRGGTYTGMFQQRTRS